MTDLPNDPPAADPEAKAKNFPSNFSLLQDHKALLECLVKAGMEAYAPSQDVLFEEEQREVFEKELRERMTRISNHLTFDFELVTEKIHHAPYRRGMSRLVGNARCSECQQFKPANTTFSNDPKSGACAWMVCDECLRGMLPPV